MHAECLEVDTRKISRPVFFSAAIVTIEKSPSHREKHEDKTNHQRENSTFTDESVVPKSVSGNKTTVNCIFAIPLPESTSENVAVTTSGSEETKREKTSKDFFRPTRLPRRPARAETSGPSGALALNPLLGPHDARRRSTRFK
ncbi:hypothetical protein OUZ56_018819 [Daphnia magna]|uniref:Uncharacterized protein n=1 Tax=Daphnia magna TaxID=35525 RepID=A0ABQ9Z9T9_9CRUS|nr:hypothetical protein OUZ56_018819 [Daphnia magna]